MEELTENGVMETSSSYSQVVFTDIPPSYPPDAPITCAYTLTAAMQPNTRDWVGIFKVGWSTTKDYHTFVWVEPCLDVVGAEPVRKQVLFREYYLPKDETEDYQFCYVDSSGQVRGASTPFCYRAAGERSMDCSLDNDLLVITTQDQLEQSEREREALVSELGRLKEQNDALTGGLEERGREVEQLKERNDALTAGLEERGREVDQLKLSNVELVQTVSRLETQQQQQAGAQEQMTLKVKEQQLTLEARVHEELTQTAKPTDAQEAAPPSEERYARAVKKISQLKQEMAELRAQVDSLTGEVAQLRPRETECLNQKDRIQLLQMDLQTSQREKERLCAELQRLGGDVEALREQNQTLHRSLSTQETPWEGPEAGEWKMEHQAVLCQLEDMRARLQQETHASNAAMRRAEKAERELMQVGELKKQVGEHLETTSTQINQKNSQLEVQVAELVKQLEDKDHLVQITLQGRDQLARDNQGLTRDIERLHRELSCLQAAPSTAPPAQPTTPPALLPPRVHLPSPAPVVLQHANPYASDKEAFVDLTSTSITQQQGSWSESLTYGNPYENTGPAARAEEVVSLECQYCQERFPGITEDELEAHEQSHRVCPFCTLICDAMEQAVFEDHVYSHEV